MITSPTSILDSHALSPTVKQDTNRAIGLALIDSIVVHDKQGKFSKPINRTALFGSKLKVRITVSPNEESPKSPADFGIRTKNSQISSPPMKDCYFTRQLSLKEMELSEDYTRVITHGPNPKTTHIFDDCIVEGCFVDDDDSKKNYEEDSKMMECGFEDNNVVFSSFCHTCKDHLEQGKDINIYRGEKAF